MATTAVGPSLLESVKEIAPIIRENAAASERERRLSDQSVEAMKRAGFFRMTKPRAYGGMEVDALTAIQVYEEVSRVDASAGWNLFLTSSAIVFGNWMPDECVAELLADPDGIWAGALFPPGKAIPVDGGYRITGRWPFASGCQHATWFLAGSLIYDGDEPRKGEDEIPIQLLAAFPAVDAEIMDTWHTMGMRGTGSHDIAIKDLFVPSHRVAKLTPVNTLPKALDGPLCRLSLWLPVAALAAVALGNARAAIDALVDLGGRKTPAYTGSTIAAKSASQMQLAQAEALLGAARAYLYESVQAAWNSASQGRFLTQPEKITIQLAATHAVSTSAQVADLVHQAAGTSAIRLEQPFERCFRDAHVITQHAFTSMNRFESAGKLLFGQETDWAFFNL
jgi:alkylation response protein AidB-like acyl-CoA dehydrogenase